LFVPSQSTIEYLMRRLQYNGSICISGLTAAGKTTHSHLLAGEFGLTYVSGSQIQLNFMGVSPIQPKDFWISERAKAFWDKSQFERIDAELARLENIDAGYMFDSGIMPWRHKGPAFCIWLESSLESRIIKAIVSHRGRSRYSVETYHERIAEKDRATMVLCKDLYGMDIGSDLSPFDLILDIGTLIKEPTLQASLKSIAITHSIIRPAVGYYLTGEKIFRRRLSEVSRKHSGVIRRNRLLGM
jgi:CMP/dCMP kinase